MNLRFLSTALTLLAACVAQFAATSPARADTSTQCTGYVSTWPKVITTPGVYCMLGNLSGSLATNQAAITINASNVVLDCNGFSLTELSGAAGNRGVSFGTRSDIDVRNCRLNNFGQGIYGGGANQRVFLRENTVAGARGIALQLSVSNGGIIDNRVVDTVNAGAAIYLIVGNGAIGAVNGNIVRNLTGPAAGMDGIWVYGAGRAVVQENVISGIGTGTTTVAGGIRIGSTVASVPADITGNHFYNPTAQKSYGVLKSPTSAKSRCDGNYFAGGMWYASLGCL